MLDLTGMVFSTVVMLFVVLRAVTLDALLPWFQGPSEEPQAAGPDAARPGRQAPSWRDRVQVPDRYRRGRR